MRKSWHAEFMLESSPSMGFAAATLAGLLAWLTFIAGQLRKFCGWKKTTSWEGPINVAEDRQFFLPERKTLIHTHMSIYIYTRTLKKKNIYIYIYMCCEVRFWPNFLPFDKQVPAQLFLGCCCCFYQTQGVEGFLCCAGSDPRWPLLGASNWPEPSRHLGPEPSRQKWPMFIKVCCF